MDPKPDLSDRQKRILDTIRECVSSYGYPPTIREIGETVGISSTSVVSYNLNVLQRKGYLTRSRDVSRGLRLIESLPDTVSTAVPAASLSIPLLGIIAAGEPIPVPESGFSPTDSETISVTPDIVKATKDVYALEVHGTSMVDALINDGDIVIMQHRLTAENGDMIAAWLKDEKATTLKRFYWEKDRKTRLVGRRLDRVVGRASLTYAPALTVFTSSPTSAVGPVGFAVRQTPPSSPREGAKSRT